MSSIRSSIHFIRQHPFNKGRENRAVWNFLTWQLKSRLKKGPFVHRFTNRSKLLLQKGMRGATGNIYCGLHEFEDMAFLLHYLRPGDLFMDVGANVGSFSMLAAAHIGASTIAVEPVPDTFHWLQKNARFNKVDHLMELYCGALAEEPGELLFTSHLGAMNHVSNEPGENTITVPVTSLDKLLNGRIPRMIKIDVEGYETRVIAGGRHTLQQPQLQVVILELNQAGRLFGFEDETLHQQMLDAGFQPYTYEPYTRHLVALPAPGPHNTIYLRHPGDARQRLQQAAAFKVRNKLL